MPDAPSSISTSQTCVVTVQEWNTMFFGEGDFLFDYDADSDSDSMCCEDELHLVKNINCEKIVYLCLGIGISLQ